MDDQQTKTRQLCEARSSSLNDENQRNQQRKPVSSWTWRCGQNGEEIEKVGRKFIFFWGLEFIVNDGMMNIHINHNIFYWVI